ncbi:MAG: hypothetical protein QOI86_283 [Actinomycetota bacterium]|nr:hypothetical protein [Actinomycetota bacterium]
MATQRQWGTVAIVVAAGVLTGACGGGSGTDKSASGDGKAKEVSLATPAGPKLEIAAKEFSFTPGTLTLKAGQGSTVVLKNTGSIEHDLTVSDAGFKLTAPASQSVDKVLTVDKPGTYEFHCSVPGHKDAGMKGQLRVE